MLALSDEASETVKSYVEKEKLPFPVAAGSASGGKYGVSGIPQAFLIDSRGTIVWEGHPMEDGWLQMLPDLLAATPPKWDPGERPAALSKAVAYAREGKLAKAWDESEQQMRRAGEDPDARAAVEAFQKDYLAMAGEKRKAAEERAAAGRYFRASAFLEAQMKHFAGTPVEAEWKELLKSWKADKQAKALYALDEKLVKAMELARAGEKEAALKLLEKLQGDAKGTPLEGEVRDSRDKVRKMRS